MPDPVALKYRAFLSYSHKDKRWAQWLHGRLEAFKIDKDLRGRETALGAVPKTLRPIFRDRDEFTGGHSLTDATIAALDASAALIVVCSPSAAGSHYVNEEVRLFRWRHPGRPVIPVIVDGQPGGGAPTSPSPYSSWGEGRGEGQRHTPASVATRDRAQPQTPAQAAAPHPNPLPAIAGRGEACATAPDECFPNALRFEVEPGDGAITNSPRELLAADVREEADGKQLALAKVVAEQEALALGRSWHH